MTQTNEVGDRQRDSSTKKSGLMRIPQPGEDLNRAKAPWSAGSWALSAWATNGIVPMRAVSKGIRWKKPGTR